MSKYRAYRHPRTTQERRANQDGFGRSRRGVHRLVNAWCDVNRADLYDRCWKRHRKHQYKVKGEKKKKCSKAYGHSMSKRDHFYHEHRHCYSERYRCKYCRKHNIWFLHDRDVRQSDRERAKKEARQYAEWEAERSDPPYFAPATIIIPGHVEEYLIDNGGRRRKMYE